MNSDADPICVLHVDDDPDFAELAATFLEREDERFEVEAATSASEGLDRLAAADFDCVVSDYDMPGQNGIEFLETVRETHPDLPFLLYTGKGSEEVASEAISAGVTDYLQKGGGSSQYAVLANRIRNAVEQYRATSELENRERRLNLFFEQSPLGVIEWDDEFDLVRMNESAETILGYDGEELVGESWEVIVPESDRPAVADVVSDLLENRGGYHSVNENVRGDGERIVCEWHNRVVTDDDEVVAVFSQFQDVTERERRKRRLETLVDNLPGMVYRCRNEWGWPMEDVRGEVEALTGYEPADLTNREQVYGEEIIHPDDREEVWNAVQDSVATGESFEITYRIRTRDGATKWVWERGRGVDHDGDEAETLEGFITDVTERERARRELKAEREFIDQALDALDELFCVLDADGELRRWNDAVPSVTGYPDEELAGMTVVEFVPDGERPRIAQALDAAVRTGSATVESELRTADGERIPFEFTARRLDDTDDEVSGLVGIGRTTSG